MNQALPGNSNGAISAKPGSITDVSAMKKIELGREVRRLFDWAKLAYEFEILLKEFRIPSMEQKRQRQSVPVKSSPKNLALIRLGSAMEVFAAGLFKGLRPQNNFLAMEHFHRPIVPRLPEKKMYFIDVLSREEGQISVWRQEQDRSYPYPSMKSETLDTHQKALQINLDPTKYGTFAEIGAGQEVARWFFRVGGAAGTIAKSISAYDMIVSDAIYGAADRYVSRKRLQTMLDHEYQLLYERLNAKRGANTKFFVFADTVTARSFKNHDECHGWMGIRFQAEPQAPPSDIIIHVRMLDRDNLPQQEALGIMGVNLVHGSVYHHADPRMVVASLMDNLTLERVEVDMIKFSGPNFEGVDNRLMSLELVEKGLANAAMFTANGEVVQAAEILYKKAILVERGSFRPVTKVTIDMLECAQAQFIQEPNVQGEEIVVLMDRSRSMDERMLPADWRAIDPLNVRSLETLGGTARRDLLQAILQKEGV